MRFDEPRAFGWVVLDPDNRFGGGPTDLDQPGATWQYRLTAEDGGCRLSHSVRIGPGRTGLSLVIDRAPENEEQVIARRLDALRDAMTGAAAGHPGPRRAATLTTAPAG